MTTTQAFFKKLFEENDKVHGLYENYNFENMNPEHVKMIKSLTIISKYKNSIRKFLANKKPRDYETKMYVEQYKSALTYEEHIRYNQFTDKFETGITHIPYIFGIIGVCGFLYYVYKKPADSNLSFDMLKLFLFSSIGGFGYYKYLKGHYRNEMNILYRNLELRLNDYPDLRNKANDPNFYTDDKNSKEDME